MKPLAVALKQTVKKMYLFRQKTRQVEKQINPDGCYSYERKDAGNINVKIGEFFGFNLLREAILNCKSSFYSAVPAS